MPNSSNVKETIDERILRLIGLEDVFDLDYDTYLTLLKEQMVKGRMTQSKIPVEEVELITNEYKRLKGKKGAGRFGVKKKKINTQNFGVAKFSLATKKIKTQNLIPSKPQMLLPPSKEMGVKGVGKDNAITVIIKSLGNIIKILNSSLALEKKNAEKDRISKEKKSRNEEESRLEKGLGLIKKTVSKIISPVKNILSQILDFFMKLFVARVVYKLLEWLGNPQNQEKLKSVFRFLGDHWPTLLALYLRFGTGIGKFAGKLTSVLIRGGIKLAAAAASLLAKAGLGKAAGAAKFFGGKGGKALGTGLQVAATVGTTMAVSSGLENFGGIGGNETKVEGRSGGGFIGIPKFAGGGFNPGGFGNFFEGVVSGKKGVDKIPAMLSDGEFVMSRGAVQKYGVDTLEGMNAAGGGTNKPKMISGVPHAYGGGYITNTGREDSRANYDKKYGEGSYTKKLAEKRAKWASEDDADIAAKRSLAAAKNAKPQGSGRSLGSPGQKKTTVNGIDVTGLKSLKGMGPNITLTRDNGSGGMRPDMKRKLVEENKKSAAIDALRAREASLNKKARQEYAKIINNPDDPRYDSAWNGNLKVSDIRKQLKAKETATPSPQSAYKAAGMGNYSARNVMRAQSAAGVGVKVGAKMVGGYGLKQQSFKDSPLSQIIKDASGKNVVGHKAMKGGKLTYVQGKNPGEGTSNIWERMGRALNPNAYKQSDAAAAQKKYQEASAGSIASLKARGATQATIAKRQSELKKTAPPPPVKPRTRFMNQNGGGSKTKSQLVGRANSPTVTKVSASHPAGTKNKEAIHGLRR